MNQPRIDQINIVIRQVEAAANFLNGIGIDVPGDEGGWDSIHRNVPAHELHELAVSLGGVSLKAPYDTF